VNRARSLPRSLIEHRLQRQRRAYERTHNPLHLWESYRLCRQHDMELPEHVLAYFDRVADKLARMGENAQEAPRRIVRALEMSPKSPDGLTKSFEDTDDADKVALLTLVRMNQGLSYQDAIADVAEHAVELVGRTLGEDTVERCYEQFREMHAEHEEDVQELARGLASWWQWEKAGR